jgi:hypothetical protein
MKKHSLISLFLMTVFSLSSFAQTFIVQVKTASGKWGYANLKGDLVIPAEFDNCTPFSEYGVAAVVKNKANIIINTKGEEIPAAVKGYEILKGIMSNGFESGLLGIQVNKKWGYLNSKGEIAIPLKYDFITEFNGGFAVAKIGTKFLVLDTKGTEIAVSASNVTDLKHFSSGLAPATTVDKKVGFVNTKGEMAIQPQFNSVGYFYGDYAWAKASDGKAGFINTKGEWIIKPAFEAVSDFDPVSKVARAKEAGVWLYIDASGNKIYVKDTDVWGDFAGGLSKGRQTDKLGFYDTKGVWVIKPQFEGVREFKNGYAAAKSGGKWGVIDTSGNWVIQPQFDGIKDVEKVN